MADVGRSHYQFNNERGTFTQHNQAILPQRNIEVVNLTGLAENKGLDAWCGKWCVFTVNGKEQGFAVVCIIRIKNRQGSIVH